MTVQYQPVNEIGNINNLNQKGKQRASWKGRALNYGFIGVDSIMRMADGESAPVAVGKAVLTNAAFSLIPGGLPVALAGMAVLSAPDMIRAMDQGAARLNAKKQQFGGNFEQTEIQMMMQQQGLMNMKQANDHNARRMANYARNNFKSY